MDISLAGIVTVVVPAFQGLGTEFGGVGDVILLLTTCTSCVPTASSWSGATVVMLLTDPVAEQPLNDPPRSMAGLSPEYSGASDDMVMVLPDCSCPAADAVNAKDKVTGEADEVATPGTAHSHTGDVSAVVV